MKSETRALSLRRIITAGSWLAMAMSMSQLWGQNTFPSSGNVGIGTTSPSAALEIKEPSTVGLFKVGDGANSMIWYGDGYNDINVYGAALRFYSATNGIRFRTGGADPAVTILNSGNVGIGTTSPAHLLHVAGVIGAEEVIVSSTGADYVFNSDYNLAPLTEVAGYIKEHHHLPGIPSAPEVEEKGVSLGEMQAKLLAKIELISRPMPMESRERPSSRRCGTSGSVGSDQRS